ncbi:hypothetical protein [Actinokineospora sp. NBRC 105648]|uniref:hypothetical protein n=1 Tax=Actinokineospora sp. NBRC 105648 TaxID=3032206 RepID=UPI0024A41CC8|nr:hypothetical protein [Actinokineospora sp. NBRC 105648]GLZ41579.1 hypothetical protein Acsp05_52030 [Actinokineospora sp. NBRC 105648]
MSAFDDLLRRAQADLAGHLLVTLRAHLQAQSRDWLIDQLLAEAAAKLGTVPTQRQPGYHPKPLPLDERTLAEHTAHLGAWDTSACLVSPPQPGGPMITARQRTAQGEDLLSLAKDMLYAILFGGPEQGVTLNRAHREVLTLTLPAHKASVFAFVRHTPDAGMGDVHLRIEFGEVSSEIVGDAVVAALRVINRLEINEEVLYARMADLEQSTLI